MRVAGFLFASKAVAVRISFSTRRAGVNIIWRNSKRLMSGSLIALTVANNISEVTVIPAVVAARPLVNLEKDRPEIDLYLSHDCIIDPAAEYIMVEETSSCFESQRHTMLALQQMARDAEQSAS